MIKKVKNIAPWIYVMQDLNGEEIYEKELQRTNQSLELKK